ncbi:MAG: class I SAM-dependent methyltransferase [Clostridia bacterium]|nr:class I SAM-dependent methyltransferase [Clostridia bacterium]
MGQKMKKNQNETLDARLLAASEYAGKGKRFADIGTDHAYLPVYLCLSGISPGGVASDINEGPILRAEKNIGAAGLGDRIVCRKADGLDGIAEYKPEDIYILGMGGELISQIIAASEYVKDPGIRLILQPMTHPQDLRKYLLENGFEILGEKTVTDKPLPRDAEAVPFRTRIYQIIYAGYSGEARKCTDYSDAELLLGRLSIEKGGTELRSLALRHASVYENAARGMESAGLDAGKEKALAAELRRIGSGQQ